MLVNIDETEIDIVVRHPTGVRRIVVTGDVDQLGARLLGRALADAVAKGPDRIEVDLAGATFFCSAAVTALTHARIASGDRLHLIAVAPVVDKLLRVAGVNHHLQAGRDPNHLGR